MLIDLNSLPVELLPDLNEPAYEQEYENTHLQEDQQHEVEAHLQDEHGHLLPDLNEESAYEEEDGIIHLHEDQLHEAEAHLQGQPRHHHHKDHHNGMHVIDLNVDASEADQEHHEGDSFSLDCIWT